MKICLKNLLHFGVDVVTLVLSVTCSLTEQTKYLKNEPKYFALNFPNRISFYYAIAVEPVESSVPAELIGKEIFDNLALIVSLYNDVIDPFKPSKEQFNTEVFASYLNGIPVNANLFGQIHTEFLNGADADFSTAQKISELCKYVKPFITGYTLQYNGFSAAKFAAQKALLTSIMKKAVDYVSDGKEYVVASNSSFYKINGFLTTLNGELVEQVKESSAYYQNKVQLLSQSDFNQVANQIRVHLFKLQIQEMLKFFADLDGEISQSSYIINEAVTIFDEVIALLNVYNVKLANIKPFASITEDYKALNIEAANGLLDKCVVFNKNHGN